MKTYTLRELIYPVSDGKPVFADLGCEYVLASDAAEAVEAAYREGHSAGYSAAASGDAHDLPDDWRFSQAKVALAKLGVGS